MTISATLGAVTQSAVLGVTPSAPPPPPPESDTVSVSGCEYDPEKGTLRVEARSTSSSATLEVYVTAAGALIGTLENKGGGRYGGQFTWPTRPQEVTVTSSLGGSAICAVVEE